MSKRPSSRIYAKEAEFIAKKLGATVDKTKAHPEALVILDNKVLRLSWRHDKKAPNGHLPKQLHLNEHKTLEMARCTFSKEQYFEYLREKGLPLTYQ